MHQLTEEPDPGTELNGRGVLPTHNAGSTAPSSSRQPVALRTTA